jgi:Na+/melibiose symporter-like transporter
MWVMLLIGTPAAIATLFMKETSKEQILLTRAKTRHQVVPHRKASAVLIEQIKIALTWPVIMLFTEPLVGCLSLYTGFAFAMVFSFLASVPYVFITVYGFDEKKVGLVFIAMMVGCVFSVVSFAIFDRKLYHKAVLVGGGSCAPEHRLYAAILGSILLPIGLFW